jgi:hypothetical protein
MAKLKAIPFILVGTVFHLVLCLAVIATVMSCANPTACESPLTNLWEQILGFPLSLIRMLSHQGYSPASEFSIFYIPLNSLLAVTIIWFALVRPFVRHAVKKNAT